MADQLHTTLSQFRDTMLTAVARLEFQIRDTLPNQKSIQVPHVSQVPQVLRVYPDVEEVWPDTSSTCSTILPEQRRFESALLQSMAAHLESLEKRLSSLATPVAPASPAVPASPADPAEQCENPNTKTIDEILTIQKDKNTRNVLVTSLRSTPALSAAVAAMNPPEMDLHLDADSEEEEDAVSVPASEADTEGEVDEQLKKIMIKGVQYYMDDDNVVYTETEDGYEQVGTYDAKTDSLILDEGVEEEEEDEEEEEEEEEAIEVEDFLYKGKTYQRDSENNVYEDGEQVGTWNGKKIVPV
jgi:hypothetical protein